MTVQKVVVTRSAEDIIIVGPYVITRGDVKIYLPDMYPGIEYTFYADANGSTFWDEALTDVAQYAPGLEVKNLPRMIGPQGITTWIAPRLPDLPVPVLFAVKRDVIQRMVSGGVDVKRVGHDRITMPLMFKSISAASFDDLCSFVETAGVADYSLGTITYIHTDNTYWSAFVREFKSSDWTEDQNGFYTGTITLEITGPKAR